MFIKPIIAVLLFAFYRGCSGASCATTTPNRPYCDDLTGFDTAASTWKDGCLTPDFGDWQTLTWSTGMSPIPNPPSTDKALVYLHVVPQGTYACMESATPLSLIPDDNLEITFWMHAATQDSANLKIELIDTEDLSRIPVADFIHFSGPFNYFWVEELVPIPIQHPGLYIVVITGYQNNEDTEAHVMIDQIGIRRPPLK